MPQITETQRELLGKLTDEQATRMDAQSPFKGIQPGAILKLLADLALAGDTSDYKDSVRLASAGALAAYTRTGNILEANANGALSVDSVAVAVGDRILYMHGTGAHRGIYEVIRAGGVAEKFLLSRALDADETGDLTTGSRVHVEEGTVNSGTTQVLTTTGTITLNSTSQTWAPLASAVDAAAVLAALATAAADVDVNSQKITSLANGAAATDAVNKGQLDAVAADVVTAQGDVDTLAAQAVISPGIPSRSYIALDDGAGTPTQPTANDTVRVVHGAFDETFTWKVAAGNENEITIGGSAADSATALAAAITAHSNNAGKITAAAASAPDMTHLVELTAAAAAAIAAGTAIAVTLAGVTPGQKVDQPVARAKGIYKHDLIRYTVTAFDAVRNGVILKASGSTIAAWSLHVETSAGDVSPIDFDGSVTTAAGGKFSIIDGGAVNLAAGNIIVAHIVSI